MRRIFFGAAVAAIAAGAVPADAAVYAFSFSDTAANLVSFGTITTTDTASAAGGFDVTSITGLAGGNAITGLSAAAGADNLLYTTNPHVDFDGISFTTTATTYNIFHGASDFFFNVGMPSVGTLAGTFAITPLAAAAAVPEPADWALLASGFALVGVGARSRKRRGFTTAI